MSNSTQTNLPELLLSAFGTVPNEMFSSYLQQSGVSSARSSQYWKPPHDIVETESKVLVLLDVPGIQQDTLKVDFRNNLLIIEGDRNKIYDEDASQSQIVYGSFRKTVALPFAVTNPESVLVKNMNGVLHVTIDKSVENRSHFSVSVIN
jgi:HSP20 family protein